MPDFERHLRKMHIDLAIDETEQKVCRAYYAGMDRARKEVAVIFGVAMTVFVLFRVAG